MTVVNKQYCPNCGKMGYRDDVSCVDCGFLLVEENQESQEIKEVKSQIRTGPKFLLNLPANLSLIFTVIAALLYAIPLPTISLYGGVPFSVFAIITAIIGLFNPNLRTRKIWAIVIAILAPAVWVTQFMFFGRYWL